MKKNELPFIKEMFENIAPTYDFLNRLLSLRRDILWRKKLASCIKLSKNSVILDVATGTADLALEIQKENPKTKIFGLDFSFNMLQIGKEKIYNNSKNNPIYVAAADAFNLPFPDSSFDALSIAFGIRNIKDKKTVLKEFNRVLKPGGKVLILELTMPEDKVLSNIYLLYFNKILPFIGRFFSKSLFAYSYLPSSVMGFPPSKEFASIMKKSGFNNIKWLKMSLGIVTMFIGKK